MTHCKCSIQAWMEPPTTVTSDWSVTNTIHEKKSFVFLLLFQSRLPFKWKTPFGYVVGLGLESLGFLLGAWSISPLLIFFIGSCWLLKSFATEVTNELRYLEVNCKTNHQNKRKLRVAVCNVVQLFADTKQLSSHI